MTQHQANPFAALISTGLAAALIFAPATGAQAQDRSHVQWDFGTPIETRGPDFSHYEWLNSVWQSGALDRMIDRAEGAAFDRLQERLWQVYENRDGIIGREVSYEFVRMIARDPERALTWWLDHPGELDRWLHRYGPEMFLSVFGHEVVPTLRRLQSEVLWSLEAFLRDAPVGPVRETAACLQEVLAALPAMESGLYYQSRSPLTPVHGLEFARFDPLAGLVDEASSWSGAPGTYGFAAGSPGSTEYEDFLFGNEPLPDLSPGILQELDVGGGREVVLKNVDSVELFENGLVVVTIAGVRAIAVVPGQGYSVMVEDFDPERRPEWPDMPDCEPKG